MTWKKFKDTVDARLGELGIEESDIVIQYIIVSLEEDISLRTEELNIEVDFTGRRMIIF